MSDEAVVVGKMSQTELASLVLCAYAEGWCDSPETVEERAAMFGAWKGSATREWLRERGLPLGLEIQLLARQAACSVDEVSLVMLAADA